MGEHEQVDRLLHDATRAHHGADFADAMRDEKNAGELRAKRNRLVQHALSFDPKRESPAWSEGDDIAAVLSEAERDRLARSRLDTFMSDVCDLDPAEDADDTIRIRSRDLRVIAERHIVGGA
jgi:hypothetical protein